MSWEDEFKAKYGTEPETLVSAYNAAVGEVNHLNIALEAAVRERDEARAEAKLLNRVINETDSLAEFERDQAVDERDRLAAQVARVRTIAETKNGDVMAWHILRALDGGHQP